jgi:hypothetical protein
VGQVALARFLFVTGRLIDGSPTPHWPVVGRAFSGAPGLDGSWVAWRVSGTNNRELGRSAEVYEDVVSCYESALYLQHNIERTTAIVAADHHSGLWVWQLDLDGHAVAVAGRPYQRHREARHSLTQFTSIVADPSSLERMVTRPGVA